MILVHIADLTNSVTQYDIEKVFMKYGEIKEVWMAKNPPCFAFVVFKNKEDAAEACKDMDQK
jgi:arginine/serine-rich splicing factor 7